MSVAVGCLPIAGIIYGEGWARLRTMPRAFLSYSHDDEAFVAELEKQLPALGWDVWRDAQNLRPGDLWPRKLGDAIAASEAFVLVWSAHAARSGVIEHEWTIAVAKKRPICILALDREPLPPSLSAVGVLRVTLHVVPEQYCDGVDLSLVHNILVILAPAWPVVVS